MREGTKKKQKKEDFDYISEAFSLLTVSVDGSPVVLHKTFLITRMVQISRCMQMQCRKVQIYLRLTQFFTIQ